mmetsp:Transcript_22133/g.69916  ORF Transcript_22133/g.69916 Transcript_22133/m.69916 type:complete len:290 (-) Transcript_22133:331-1200(-)
MGHRLENDLCLGIGANPWPRALERSPGAPADSSRQPRVHARAGAALPQLQHGEGTLGGGAEQHRVRRLRTQRRVPIRQASERCAQHRLGQRPVPMQTPSALAEPHDAPGGPLFALHLPKSRRLGRELCRRLELPQKVAQRGAAPKAAVGHAAARLTPEGADDLRHAQGVQARDRRALRLEGPTCHALDEPPLCAALRLRAGIRRARGQSRLAARRPSAAGGLAAGVRAAGAAIEAIHTGCRHRCQCSVAEDESSLLISPGGLLLLLLLLPLLLPLLLRSLLFLLLLLLS